MAAACLYYSGFPWETLNIHSVMQMKLKKFIEMVDQGGIATICD